MNTYTQRGLAAIAAVFAFGGSLALGFVTSPVAPAGSHHATAAPAEDSPAFDCRVHGNQICGPNNSQGVPAGYYGGRS